MQADRADDPVPDHADLRDYGTVSLWQTRRGSHLHRGAVYIGVLFTAGFLPAIVPKPSVIEACIVMSLPIPATAGRPDQSGHLTDLLRPLTVFRLAMFPAFRRRQIP